MLAMAYVLYFPFGFTGRSFHRYYQVYVIAVGIVILIGLLFWRKQWIATVQRETKSLIDYVKAHPLSLLFVAIVGLEVWRVVAFTQIHYSDDDTYIPLVNDILMSDQFFRVNFVDGRMLSGTYSLDMKYLLAGWFQFQAILCRFTGLHPLILIKTCLPIAIILLHYIVIWNFATVLRNEQKSDGFLYFMIVYALLMEVAWGQLSTSWSYYFLTWVWYGKAFLQLIVLPFLLLALLEFHANRITDWMLIILLIIAGCGASTMGFLLIPAEVGIFIATTVVYAVIQRRRASV